MSYPIYTLSHVGVKGMKWGVRKQAVVSTSKKPVARKSNLKLQIATVGVVAAYLSVLFASDKVLKSASHIANDRQTHAGEQLAIEKHHLMEAKLKKGAYVITSL